MIVALILLAVANAVTALVLWFVWKRFRFYAGQVWNLALFTEDTVERIRRRDLAVMRRTFGHHVRTIDAELTAVCQNMVRIGSFGRPKSKPEEAVSPDCAVSEEPARDGLF